MKKRTKEKEWKGKQSNSSFMRKAWEICQTLTTGIFTTSMQTRVNCVCQITHQGRMVFFFFWGGGAFTLAALIVHWMKVCQNTFSFHDQDGLLVSANTIGSHLQGDKVQVQKLPQINLHSFLTPTKEATAGRGHEKDSKEHLHASHTFQKHQTHNHVHAYDGAHTWCYAHIRTRIFTPHKLEIRRNKTHTDFPLLKCNVFFFFFLRFCRTWTKR